MILSLLPRLSCFLMLLISTTLLAQSPAKFSPYVDLTLNTQWSPEFQELVPMDLKTIAQTNHIRSYHLAFITDTGSCEPAWGGQASYSLDKQWGKRLTDSLNQDNVDIIVSFGGASGNDMSLNCTSEQLLAIFNKTVTTYNAKGLDFDIENGTANVPKLFQTLTLFQSQNPTVKLSLTLPTMPEGLTFSGKDIIEQAVAAKLNFNVNIMAMDYGPDYAADMGDYAKQAATALHTYLQSVYPQKSEPDLWQKIEVTPMIGVNDVSSEQFTLQNAKELTKFALTNNLASLSMWSLNRDKACADKWTNPICSGNNLQSKDYEFVASFQASL